MKAFFKKKWVRLTAEHLLILGGLLLFLMILDRIFDRVCPIRLIFDVPCPFCGMTRAHLAALRLDFAAAFSYHPLFFLGIPYLFLVSHETFFKKKGKNLYFILVLALTALFLAVYVCRLI